MVQPRHWLNRTRVGMDVTIPDANCLEMQAPVSATMHMVSPAEFSLQARKILIGFFLATILLQAEGLASVIIPSTPAYTSLNGGSNCVIVAASPIMSSYFGTKVLDGDIDVGRMLSRFETSKPVFAYWDVGLTDRQFDPGDVIYLNINDKTNETNVGDIRMTPYSYHLPGSRVATYDTDLNKKLTKFDREWSIVFVDQFGSTGYDLLDPVYLHVGGELAQIGRLDLRLSNSANGPAGSLVNGLDDDRGLAFTSLPGMIRFYNVNGNFKSDGTPIYDLADRLYLDLSPRDSQGFVLVNDIRLT